MALDAILQQIVTVQQGITGIKEANVGPTLPQGFPSFQNLMCETDGDIKWHANQYEIPHEIRMLLLFQKENAQGELDLEATEIQARPFVESVTQAFSQNLTLGGTVTVNYVKSYKYGAVRLFGQLYAALEFRLHALELVTTTYKP